MRMENMRKIIMGPALFLCLLFLIMSDEMRHHQCEANVSSIENSSIVAANEAINGTGNISDTSFDDGHHNATSLPLPTDDNATTPAQANGNASLPTNITSTNTTSPTELTTAILEEDFSITPHKKPCPIPNASLPRTEHHDDNNEGEHKTNQVGTAGGNGTDINSNSTVKDEKHETALEKITDSISGVMKTIKNSFTSIFKPGTGIPSEGRHEYLDCYTNDTIAGGEGKTNTTTSSSGVSSSNMTSLAEEGEKKDQGDIHHHPQMSEKEEGKILIHPASNNDTIINAGIMSNNTNETNSTTTSTLPPTTALPVTENSETPPTTTAAPAVA